MRVKNLKMYGTLVLDDGTEVPNYKILDHYGYDSNLRTDGKSSQAICDVTWEVPNSSGDIAFLKLKLEEGILNMLTLYRPYEKSFFVLDKDAK